MIRTNSEILEAMVKIAKPSIVTHSVIKRAAGRLLKANQFCTGLTVPYRNDSAKSFILIEESNYRANPSNALDVLIHEYAHSLRTVEWVATVTDPKRTDASVEYARTTEELYADMVAMYVKEAFGLDFSDDQWKGHFQYFLDDACAAQIREARLLAKRYAAEIIHEISDLINLLDAA